MRYNKEQSCGVRHLVLFGDGLRGVYIDMNLTHRGYLCCSKCRGDNPAQRRWNQKINQKKIQRESTHHADRVDSVPLVCDGVALAKEHVAKVGAAVAAHCLEGRALGTAKHVTFFAGPEA